MLKNLRESVTDTFKVSHFYQNILASECVCFSLLSYTQQVHGSATSRVTLESFLNGVLVLQSFIDLEINICSLTDLQDYMEVMIRFLCHLF